MSAKTQLPQIEGPQNEAASSSGFFMLSHSVFTDSRLAQLSGDTFKLYLWMSSQAWRFPTSDGTIRAAISFISKGTLMSHATVSRALKSLISHELISIRVVDYKAGNIWSVTPFALAKTNSNFDSEVSVDATEANHLSQNELPQIEAPQTEVVAPSKRGRSSLNLR